jgi:type III restriction enzyme
MSKDDRIDAGWRFGIAPASLAKLTALFETTPGIDRVWIYGSRARGDHRESSDIDLMVDAARLSELEMAQLQGRLEDLGLIYRTDLSLWQRLADATFRQRVENDRRLFWESRRFPVQASELGGVELKDFQQQALDHLDGYLRELSGQQATALRAADALRAAQIEVDPALIDYPAKAWQALRADGRLPATYASREHSSRFDGAGRPIPNVCLKVPTGGGKTLLAAASVARVFSGYLRRHIGLVLWVMPNEAIYAQTKKALSDRDHPYRQMLNVAGAGRVKILEKDSPLSRLDLDSHLCVMLLMLQSAARQSKETLRFFRDRGSVHGFFPREDDLDGHWRVLGETPNLDVYAPFGATAAEARATRGSIIKDSLGNVMRLTRPMVIIDEGHHAYTENALRTIDGFNPSFVLELSATPRAARAGQHAANILVDVRGADLERAEMIKLPINVDVRPWPDWQSCLSAAWHETQRLAAEAEALQADTARYIRPILLVQVERTGADQRGSGLIHSEDVKAWLLQVGLQERQIAIKTSERNDLQQPENLDLLSPASDVRVIITRSALQEGWDCPFAYVLCALAAGRNLAALTQLIGRILRQPQVAKTGRPALDECYVFCHDAQTAEVVNSVKASLEGAGMGDLAVSVRTSSGDSDALPTTRLRRRPGFERMRIFLPRVTWNGGDDRASRRELVYESDVLSNLDWQFLDPARLCQSWAPTPDTSSGTRLRLDLGILSEVGELPIAQPVERGGSASLDREFVVRALLDLVPNPWIAWTLVAAVVDRLQSTGLSERTIAGSLASFVERLRADIETERDSLAEAAFDRLVQSGCIAFSLRADMADYSIGDTFEIAGSATARSLQRSDGNTIERSLFTPCLESLLDSGFETEFACYLDSQRAVHWWHRNVARTQYGLQGWKRHKIYPDFVFAKVPVADHATLVVMETKGAHLKNEDTDYKQKLLARLSSIYRDDSARRVGELELVAKGGQTVVCDLLFDEAWQGTMEHRHFSG